MARGSQLKRDTLGASEVPEETTISIRYAVGLVIIASGLLFGGREIRIGYAVIAGLLAIGALLPRSPITRRLFSRVGPSLDAAHMSRSECLRSAGGYGVIAVLAFVTVFGGSAIGETLGRDPWDIAPLAAVLFTYSIFMLVGVGGALYLLIRAPFRPRVRDDANSPAAGA